MTVRLRVHETVVTTAALLLATGLVACGERTPRTDAERLARGKEIVTRMSEKLGSAKVFSVRTTEDRDQLRPGGKVQPVKFTRELVVRRPDRLYFKTTGDMESEGWYDGVGLTLAMHKDKVFAQARMPETLDRTLDAIQERYGITLPAADLLYSSPSKALLSDKTTGGWAGRETVDGKTMDHLAFGDRGVAWELWVPTTGDPLPARLVVNLPNDKRLRKVDIRFSDWNFSPEVLPDRFDPKVPADYEGVAMIQRAAVLSNTPDDSTPTSGTKR